MNRSVLLLFVVLTILLSGCTQSESENELSRARKAFINKEYAEAERFYQRYLRDSEVGEERWEVWNRLIEISGTVRGNKKRAIELLDAMLLEYAEDTERYKSILISKGRMYVEGGLWRDAARTWLQLLSAPEVTVEQEAQAYANLGKAYLMQGDYGLAVDAYADCRELAYNDVRHELECIFDLAQAFAFLGNHEDAEKNLLELLSKETTDIELIARAKLLLADIYEQQEKPEEAIALLQEIQDSYPNPRVVEFRLDHLQKKK